MGKGEPEPELSEDQQADQCWHVSVTRPGLQRDCHITSTWTKKVRGGKEGFSIMAQIYMIFIHLPDDSITNKCYLYYDNNISNATSLQHNLKM